MPSCKLGAWSHYRTPPLPPPPATLPAGAPPASYPHHPCLGSRQQYSTSYLPTAVTGCLCISCTSAARNAQRAKMLLSPIRSRTTAGCVPSKVLTCPA